MTDEQKAAYIHAQAVAAYIETQGMIACNQYREMRGESQAWDEEAFRLVIDQYGLSTNALLAFFHQ